MKCLNETNFKVGDIVCCPKLDAAPRTGMIIKDGNISWKGYLRVQFGYGDWLWVRPDRMRFATKKEKIEYALRELSR